jgi:hypothetical protein
MCTEFVMTLLKSNDLLCHKLEEQEGLWVCLLTLQAARTIESA